ncbi:MAG: hypothetical protein ACE5E5_06290 [Phycisphaerae bacterium]
MVDETPLFIGVSLWAGPVRAGGIDAARRRIGKMDRPIAVRCELGTNVRARVGAARRRTASLKYKEFIVVACGSRDRPAARRLMALLKYEDVSAIAQSLILIAHGNVLQNLRFALALDKRFR